MSVTAPAGFRAAGVAAGLKSRGGLDVAAIVNDGPAAVAAAVWTSNRCKANPVLWSEQALKDGSARVVVAGHALAHHPVQVPTHSGLVHAAGRLTHRRRVQALLFENG